MRILVIANLPPWVLGGAENQVARLVEVWSGLGHHVEVAGHRIPDGRADLGGATVSTHRIAVIEGFGRIGRATSYLVSMAWLLFRSGRNFDVIYSRGLGDGALSICLLKSIGWTGPPLVACPINARGTGDTRFIRSIPGWRWIVAAVNRHCRAINLIAPAIGPDLAEIGITRPRLSRIPNGIGLAPELIRESAAPIRRLIWTGRLSPQKGLDLLLPALGRVAASGRNFHLELVGDGPERPFLEALTGACGLEGRVDFAGAIPRENIRDRLAAADAFVLPSRYEGMSNAALEAMEAGLPLLLTQCGGIDTYVDETIGWLSEPEDSDSLFDALCRLLDAPDSELLVMGRRARSLVERNFEIGAVGRQNAALLAEVAATGI